MRTRIRSAVMLLCAAALASCSDGGVIAPAAPPIAPRAPRFAAFPTPTPTAPRISELHYDNVGNDAGEAIEIEAPVGISDADLAEYSVVLYNGTGGASYGTRALSAGGTAPNNTSIVTCTDRRLVVLNFGVNGIQNGSPDGLALVRTVSGVTSVVEFLSYEGTFAATNGAANGVTSTDIGATEAGTEAIGLSLKRAGAGTTFSGPAAATFGTCEDAPSGPPPAPPTVTSVEVTPTTATINQGATQTFTAVAKNGADVVPNVQFTWTTGDVTIATIGSTSGIATASSSNTGTVNIIATPTGVTGTATGTAALTVQAAPGGPVTPPGTLPSVRFSEIHYDNDGTDVGEGIEIEAPAGTNLDGYKVSLYSLSSGVVSNYGMRDLSGIVSSLCDGRGVVVLEYPTNGLQNGPTDGMALIDPSGAVVEFLSYEGVLTATIGAATITSVDIGVSQTSALLGTSLQRSLAGTWASAPSNFYGCNGRTTGRQITNTAISISGRNDDGPLIVGFEGQIFATVVNGSESVPFVWSSDTPTIATIDSDGVITARAAGTAIFRVTTVDGLTTATYSLPMADGVAGSPGLYVGNAAFGEPTDGNPADDLIIRRAEYTSSFNTTRNTPNWVAYNLDQSHILAGADRCNCFTYDPELPFAKRYTTNEFTGVGSTYNRGHLARSFDRTTGSLDNARTFYFSNIIPQAADNNQGPWAAFETYLGNLALTGDKEIYIITGVAGNIGTLKSQGNVVIPENVWKVAVILPRNQGLADFTSTSSAEVISVIMPNVNGIRNVAWQTYQTTVNAVQQLSGYDVLAALNESVECKVEVRNCLPEPVLVSASGSSNATAGTPFVLNTSATDADGANGPWRYVLEWGDGTSFSATLAALPSSSRPLARAKTYTTPGTYTARLTITDKNGGKGVQTFVITVN